MSSTASRADEGHDPAPPYALHPSLSREAIAQALGHIRELHEQERRPDEGLRERKKRITRQLISDTATWLFCERGFDNVRVAEIAAEVGVSEKTVFNYFPTKESLVFDQEADLVAGVREALTSRGPGVSPTQAMVAFVERECAHLDALGPDFLPLFLAFSRMVEETPALRAARQELSGKLVAVAREALAESAGLDPRDPEPAVAAQALVSLWDVQLTSRRRHVERGVSVPGLRDAVLDDIRRAARLLDTGLWSLNTVAEGATESSGLREAAAAADEARRQVVDALRQARAAWAQVRGCRGAGERRDDRA